MKIWHFILICIMLGYGELISGNKDKFHENLKSKYGKRFKTDHHKLDYNNKTKSGNEYKKSADISSTNSTNYSAEILHESLGINIFNTIDDGNDNSDSSDSTKLKNERSTHHPKDLRNKRGVAQLYNMVSCATGCDPISYKGYGCYCGFLGSGEITDAIDRCCMFHDLCYSTVGCPPFFVYFMSYLWRCRNSLPYCALDNLEYNWGGCAMDLCECDRQLALCLSLRPCPMKRAICTSSPLRFLQNIIMY